MNTTVEFFKSIFGLVWLEHYSIFYGMVADISMQELTLYCTESDWDEQLSLEAILGEEDEQGDESLMRVMTRIEYALVLSDCGCALCAR